MGFDVEVLFLLERDGCRVREMPVRVTNSPRSSVRVVRDGVMLVRDLCRIRWWAGHGRYDGQGVAA
jgi:hypothetical protein